MRFSEPLRALRHALRPLPDWPNRRALTRDAVLAALVAVGLVLEGSVAWTRGDADPAPALLLHTALFAVGLLVIVLTRLYPVLAVIVALLGSLVSITLGFLVLCAAFLLGRRSPTLWPAVTVFAAGTAVWLAVLATVWSRDVNAWTFTVVTLVFSLVLPWLIGVYRRQHAALTAAGWEHARHIQREHRLTAEQVRLRERSRIAQDMHDSLGHELSLIALRAGALEVTPDLSDEHRRAVAELRADAVNATTHLREIIGVLRADAEPAPMIPADEGVPALVERARDSGMRVMLVRDGDVSDLPPMVGRAAHRVVQEALTNAAKYAPDASVTVWLGAGDTALEVRITNAPPVGVLPETPEGGGRGLIGLRERVRVAGGSFTAGPRGGGWEVAATLPLGDALPVVSAQDTEHERSDDIDRLQRAARRRFRGWTVALAALPVTLLVVGVIVSVGPMSLTPEEQVLPPEDLARISVGDTREEAERHLPADSLRLTAVERGLYREPEGAECAYYHDGSPLLDPEAVLHQVCFRDGRVVRAGTATID
ncbi:sensor histidine kinase [Nocardiopsis sp. FIRDI 009]|uniref:sensor histidine kinase n=1 Tax=Nocardiopsis sp. FIRDI 009 TaxID=714197 RepID=UPI000E252096|nr:histidine kinase [Nocardiopsis sp. FIRDI 009]